VVGGLARCGILGAARKFVAAAGRGRPAVRGGNRGIPIRNRDFHCRFRRLAFAQKLRRGKPAWVGLRRLAPALTRSILADLLLNLSEYEIASVQVLSQRLDLLEELQATRAKIPLRRNRCAGALGSLRVQIKNSQNFLMAAKHFVLAMTGWLETEHRKLEALVVSLRSSAR